MNSTMRTEYTGPNDGLVCIPGMNDLAQLDYVNDASVSVLWTGPNVRYYLETEVDPLTGIIYMIYASQCMNIYINSDIV